LLIYHALPGFVEFPLMNLNLANIRTQTACTLISSPANGKLARSF